MQHHFSQESVDQEKMWPVGEFRWFGVKAYFQYFDILQLNIKTL